MSSNFEWDAGNKKMSSRAKRVSEIESMLEPFPIYVT